MRRFPPLVVLAISMSLALATPASALTRIVTNLPPRQGVMLPEDTCFHQTVTMTERSERVLTITLADDGSIVRYDVRGPQTTEFVNDQGVKITIETTGTATYTKNDDGTWTEMLRGSAPVIVPPSDPIGPTLMWFTGTATSVGTFIDERSLLFAPSTQVREGISSDICGMLVTGLKTRHGF